MAEVSASTPYLAAGVMLFTILFFQVMKYEDYKELGSEAAVKVLHCLCA